MSSSFKLIIIGLIPLYLVVLFYIYSHHKERLFSISKEREELLLELATLEEKMKMESSKSPSTKRNIVEFEARDKYKNDITQILSDITFLTENIEKIKEKANEEIKNSLEEITEKYKNYEYKEKEPQITVVKSNEVKSTKDDEDGPTNNKEINNRIKESMKLREGTNALYEQLSENTEKEVERLNTIWRKFNETSSKALEERREKQWKMVDLVSLLEEEVKSLKSNFEETVNKLNEIQINENDYNSLLDSSIEIERLNDFTEKKLKEVERLNEKYKNLNNELQEREFYKTNFHNENDYEFLKKHFKIKELKYKKLFSNHQLLTKEALDEEIKGKKNLLFYFNFLSERRVGVFIGMNFPIKTKFSRGYKDDSSLIIYFNAKQIYQANPESKKHIRTESDHIFLIGNTKNNDGIMFKNPTTSTDYTVNFGFSPADYILENGTLFSHPVYDIVKSFEVFQLELDESEKIEEKVEKEVKEEKKVEVKEESSK